MKKFKLVLVAMFAATALMAQDYVYLYHSSGKVDEIAISEFDSLSFTKPESILPKDACGNEYNTVTIGDQVWLKENMRCNKYDTESEAYNATWLTGNTIPTSESSTFTPYYTDASDKSKWDSDSKQYGVNLTDAQVNKLGYLYNWAAAVGVEDGRTQTTAFTGKRQGICPNGWHIPTSAEWQTLYDYIYKDKSLTSNEVGKYLKTTYGWYSGGNGLDTYGFAALPAGYAYGSRVVNVGINTNFWTATPDGSDSPYAHVWGLGFYNGGLNDDDSSKDDGQSVRCLKD